MAGAWSRFLDMLSCPHHRLQKTAAEVVRKMVFGEDEAGLVVAGIVPLALHALQLHISNPCAYV